MPLPLPQVVPAPPERCKHITGFPAGSWLNYAAWSPDGGLLGQAPEAMDSNAAWDRMLQDLAPHRPNTEALVVGAIMALVHASGGVPSWGP